MNRAVTTQATTSERARQSIDPVNPRCAVAATAIAPRIPGIRFSHETQRRNAFTAEQGTTCRDNTAARAQTGRRNDAGISPGGSALGSAGPYGHWPLFTQPGAGCALTVGAANDVAIVTAGGSKVAVAPMLMSVGSTFMAGTVGDA